MIIANGATDVTTYFVLRDSTNHAPKTDVTVTDIDLYYVESRAAISAKADATALGAANSAHGDNQAFHCGQGLYRIDWPDAAFDGGIGKTVTLIVVCAGVDTTFLEVELTPPANTTHVGGTAQTARDLGASVLVGDKTGFSLADATSDAVIADAVWNAATATYGTAGTYGEKLEAQNTASVTVAAMGASTLTASALADDAATEIADAVWSRTTRQLSSAQAFNLTGDITGNLSGSVNSVTGNVGGNVSGNVTGSVGSIATGGIAGTSFVAGAINANAIATNAITSDEIAATACDKIADAILDRNMATGTDSGSATVRTPRQALRFLRNKWSTSGTTISVCKEDDATTSWTAQLTSNASAEPIVGVDPASS